MTLEGSAGNREGTEIKGENYQGRAATRSTGEGRLRKVAHGIGAERAAIPDNVQKDDSVWETSK